jgi:hypothetical protein
MFEPFKSSPSIRAPVNTGRERLFTNFSCRLLDSEICTSLPQFLNRNAQDASSIILFPREVDKITFGKLILMNRVSFLTVSCCSNAFLRPIQLPL